MFFKSKSTKSLQLEPCYLTIVQQAAATKVPSEGGCCQSAGSVQGAPGVRPGLLLCPSAGATARTVHNVLHPGRFRSLHWHIRLATQQ